VSEQDDDLELQALQRELDDAFATTRPRRGYEDEVWLLIQQQRPVTNRLRDAFAGFFQGIREVPAVPLAAVASILVVAIGVGVFASAGGFGRGHFGGSTTAGPALSEDTSGRNNSGQSASAFGPLPVPVGGTKSTTPPPQAVGQPSSEYYGPAQLVWSGTSQGFSLGISTAPVFRYQEPSAILADQFAGSLGAALVDRPDGYLGNYSATTYSLRVRGTVQSPPSSPAYFILANLQMPDVQAAGATAQDIANIFLAEHSLLPQWPYTVSVDSSADPIKVHYEREFTVPGYGQAHLVDASGTRYGMDVYVSGKHPILVSGPLPVNLDTAYYRIVSPEAAINASSSVQGSGPTIQLTNAELVYVLVPAGDHSFYEPAFLLSGSFQLNGKTMVKHVVVPAIDPSQRAK
jgi:hypothetical protein